MISFFSFGKIFNRGVSMKSNSFKIILILFSIALISLYLLWFYLFSNTTNNCNSSYKVPKLKISSDNEITDNYSDINFSINNKKSIESLIKLHGNSTKGAIKKPYKLKLNNRINLLGINEVKQWILLANSFDSTLLRNKIVLDFANKTRIKYTVNSEFIDLYINDDFYGNYLITEKIKSDKNMIDIDIDRGDFLLEYESNRLTEGKSYFITDVYNWRYEVKDIDLFNEEKANELKSLFSNVEKVLKSNNYNQIKKYIDIDSMVDLYIIEEYFKDPDCGFSSLYLYFKDGKLYAGPAWDFDLAMGNHPNEQYNNINNQGDSSGDSTHSIYANQHIFGELLKNKEFKKNVIKRYKELQPQIKGLYTGSSSMIDKYYDTYKESLELDVCRWYGEKCNTDYLKNEIQNLKKWLRKRNEWLLNEFKIATNDYEI